MKRFYIFILLISFLFSLSAQELQISAVQFEINPGMYESAEVFQAQLESIVKKACENIMPDLIIFPEYTGVFAAAFSCDLSILRDMENASSLADSPQTVSHKLDPEAGSVSDFFSRHNPIGDLDRIFGTLAYRYKVHILAGSYFAVHNNGSGIELRNRALLYGPNGIRVYQQDKVFLTPFESELVGIKPGNIENSRPFTINDVKIGITICLDTFYPVWETKFTRSDVDIWIDIKANGEIFDETQQQIFLRALPARIAGSKIPLGVTVCLTGTFFDLVWQGYSSFIIPDRFDGVRTLLIAENPVDTQILDFTYLNLK